MKLTNQDFQARSTLCLAGDLVLDLPDADDWLSGVAPAIRAADLAIGHVEVPHTTSRDVLEGDVPAPGAPLENLQSIAAAGFDCVTLAGNHIADCGAAGIADTILGLQAAGVASTGAGADLDAARRPAILTYDGQKIAVLSYNCVGPENAGAQADRAGCAWLPVVTVSGAPVAPSLDIAAPADGALDILLHDIATAREMGADIVIVALHKGKVHTPAYVAPYERALAHLAIDAGCDLVVSHHAHIIRGFEFYRDKPIFHGLGNGCVVTEALSPGQDNAARAAWVERRKKLFGFEPDPAYTYAPFHPEAVNAMLGVAAFGDSGEVAIGFTPVFIEPPGRPVIAKGEQRAAVLDYIARLNARCGLPEVALTDHGDVVEVAPC